MVTVGGTISLKSVVLPLSQERLMFQGGGGFGGIDAVDNPARRGAGCRGVRNMLCGRRKGEKGEKKGVTFFEGSFFFVCAEGSMTIRPG